MTRGTQGKEVGGGAGKWRHAAFHSIMPVEGVVAGAAAAAILAGLQPLQGTWSLGLSFKVFLFIHKNPKGDKKKKKKEKKETPCHNEEG